MAWSPPLAFFFSIVSLCDQRRASVDLASGQSIRHTPLHASGPSFVLVIIAFFILLRIRQYGSGPPKIHPIRCDSQYSCSQPGS
jgi:hypothetical protein